MALKGSATIELTNADGNKEIIKHDNMITNAVNDLLISQRGEMATILKYCNNNDSYAQALFGGILLFNETLNDNADDYFLPTTNIVGYASQDAYGGLDVARGSYNASEGGLQEDGSYKFVWDFSTSQANGTIKSIGLCPKIMGQIGASDTAVSSESKNFYEINETGKPFNNYGRMMFDTDKIESTISSYCLNIVAVIGDIGYAIDEYSLYKQYGDEESRHITANGGVLRLYRFKLGANNISINNKVGMATYIGYTDVTLPSDFISSLYQGYQSCVYSYFFDALTNKLIVFPCYKKSDIAVNGTMNYIEIDMVNNMAINSYTFTNNTAGTIKNGGTSHNRGGQRYTLFVCSDYIVNFSVVGSQNKMYVTKRSDNTQVKEVKYSDSKEFGFNSTDALYFSPVFVRDNILVFRYSISDNAYYFYILDMSTGIIKKTNASNMSVDNMVDIGSDVAFCRAGSYLAYRTTMNPFILTTKNNLDSPITKTSSQTMKITYTLSESEAV